EKRPHELKILGPQTAQNRSAAGWQWFADPRERVEIGKRGFFQQAPKHALSRLTRIIAHLLALPSPHRLVISGHQAQ
ncbi:MAG: hypothetical protein K7J46_22215, partial [Bryobacter sp.]|nr:hypothetical protein [Bryobacter sp. CoA8 C33]